MAAKPTVATSHFSLVGAAFTFFEGMAYSNDGKTSHNEDQFKFVTQLAKETARLAMWW